MFSVTGMAKNYEFINYLNIFMHFPTMPLIPEMHNFATNQKQLRVFLAQCKQNTRTLKGEQKIQSATCISTSVLFKSDLKSVMSWVLAKWISRRCFSSAAMAMMFCSSWFRSSRRRALRSSALSFASKVCSSFSSRFFTVCLTLSSLLDQMKISLSNCQMQHLAMIKKIL